MVQLQDIDAGRITYRARNTKTKQTRSVIVAPPLAELLEVAALPGQGYLFPGCSKRGYISTQAVDKASRLAYDYVGFEGVSPHSFSRWRSLIRGESLLTNMYRQEHSFRTLQQITYHADIEKLTKYLSIEQAEVDEALYKLWI